MKIDLTSESPELQRVQLNASAKCESYYVAAETLWDTLRLEIDPKQLERCVARGGGERQDERQELIERFQGLTLVEKEAVPPGLQLVPEVAAVQMDGGRYQRRVWEEDSPVVDGGAGTPAAAAADTADSGLRDEDLSTLLEEDESPAGSALVQSEPDIPSGEEPRNKGCWREDKVGVLQKLRSAVQVSDPAPHVPEGFLNVSRMGKLAQEIKNARQPESGGTFGESPPEDELDEDLLSAADRYDAQRPQVVGKQVVATTQASAKFGWMLAAEAWLLGLFAAQRRAFLGDGQSTNWTIRRKHFPTFTPILDFIHLLTYIYAAAFAGRTCEAGTPIYRQWIQWAWSGRVDDLVSAFAERLCELPPVTKDDKQSPQAVVQGTLRYIQNNRSRMNYPEYRRLGLPITTSAMESTVKQINQRVKGTEKFFSKPGAEALLQLRAEALSDFHTLDDFHARREKRATGLHRHRRKTALGV